MNVEAPYFLLLSESCRVGPRAGEAGVWRFVLKSVDGSVKLEASDVEPQVARDRLDLLAVVRGLEALDQPSRVTLVTSSRYVSRGLRFGLQQWRENNWQWERYGTMAPINNGDLWKRIDHALQFHRLECRMWRFDRTEQRGQRSAAAVPAPHWQRRGRSARAQRPLGWRGGLRLLLRRAVALLEAVFGPTHSRWCAVE